MNKYKVEVKDLEGKITNAGFFDTEEKANEWVTYWMNKEKPWYRFKGGEFPKKGMGYLGSSDYPDELVVREFEKVIPAIDGSVKKEIWVEVKDSFTVEVINNSIEYDKYKDKEKLKEDTLEELKIKALNGALKNDELTDLIKIIMKWE